MKYMIRLILIAAIIIFYLIRWRVSVLKRASKNKISRPLAVGELLTLAIVIFQLAGFDFLKFNAPPIVSYLGLAVALSGAIFSSVARLTLKENYVPATASAAPENLVIGGIYKIVRHPSYLGSLLAFIGFELALNSYLIFITLVILVTVLKQIRKEEKIMAESFQNEWQTFAKRTPYKLVPFIY
jgi:protein-S-isoprenylcysteine O-methyltransferase Ste14